MRIFILEDDGTRMGLFYESLFKHEIVHKGSVENAIKVWRGDKQGFSLALLDHDLGNPEHYGTGLDFAHFLSTRYPMCPVIIHSWNADGAKSMEIALAGWKYKVTVERIPFGLTLLKRLESL